MTKGKRKSLCIALMSCFIVVATAKTYGQPTVELYRTEDVWGRETARNTGVPSNFEDHSVRKVQVGPTGDYGLTIPLVTVPGRSGVDASISLTYKPGVRVMQEPSWVGTGWDLDLGSIKRNPVIRMDEFPDSLIVADCNQWPGDCYPGWYTATESDEFDLYRDTYTINCPGGSGTIIQVPIPGRPGKYTFMMEDWRPWRIEYDTSQLPYAPYTKHHRFVVTVENGTRYVFGQDLLGGSSNVYIAQSAIGSLPLPYNGDQQQYEWKLTAILGPGYLDLAGDPLDPLDGLVTPIVSSEVGYGPWVAIAYHTPEMYHYRQVNSPHPPISFLEVTYPRFLVTPTHTVEFTLEQEPVNFVSKQLRENSNYPETKKRLKTIALKRYWGLGSNPPGTGPELKRVEFTYYSPGTGHLENRSFLKQVTLRGGDQVIPPYKFEYWAAFAGGTGPSYDMSQTDPASTHIGNEGWYVKVPSSTGFHYHDSLDGNAWNLTRIVYPTGGEIKFTYRSDRARYYEPSGAVIYGSGTRLNSQTILSGTGDSSVYQYQYATMDMQGSYLDDLGTPLRTPIDYFGAYHGGPPNYFLSSWSMLQKSMTIMYGRITEVQPNGSKIVSYYSVRRHGDTEQPTDSSDIYAKCLKKRGLLVRKEYKNTNGVVIKEEQFGRGERIVVTSRVRGAIMQVSSQLLADTIWTTVYDESGQNGITTSSIAAYHPLDGMVSQRSITNSDGQTFVTRYTRPMHFGDLTENYALVADDVVCYALAELQRLNIIDKVIAHDELRDSAGTVYVLSSEFTKYRCDLEKRHRGCGSGTDEPCEGGNEFPRPSSHYRLQVTRPTPISSVVLPYLYLEGGTTYRLLHDSRYTKTNSILAVDAYGNTRETRDGNGTWTTTKWGSANSNYLGSGTYTAPDTLSLQFATIVNSTDRESLVEPCEHFRQVSGGILAFSMEPVPNSSIVSLWRSDTSSVLGSSQGVSLGGSNTPSLVVRVDTMYTTREYIVEFDYKVQQGVLRLYRDNGQSSYEMLEQLSPAPMWQHFRGQWSFGSDSLDRRIAWGSESASSFLLDNIRIYPSDAYCTSVTFDPYSLNIIGEVDRLGQTTTYCYDGFQRLTEVFDGAKHDVFTYFHSSSVNGSFNPNSPNSLKRRTTVNIPTDLVYDGSFEDIINTAGYVWSCEDWNIVQVDSVGSVIDGWKALRFISQTNLLSQDLGVLPDSTAYTISAWFKAPPGTSATLIFGDYDFSPPYSSVDSVTVDGNNQWQELTFTHEIVSSDTCFVHIRVEPGATVDLLSVKNIDVMNSENSMLSAEYSDGFGASIQKVRRNLGPLGQSANIVSGATVYDNMRRLSKVYKTYEIESQNDAAYDANFAANALAYSGGGSVPFSQTAYLPDPLGQIEKQSNPGSAFAMGSGRELSFSYSVNKAGDNTGFADNTLFKTRKRDEDGRVTSTFADKLGNTVLVTVDSGGMNLRTQFKYEAPGQVQTSIDPRGLHTSYVYNTLGQIVQKSSPDAGSTKFRYDKNGNLRFSQDATQFALGKYTYRKYDHISRVVETGEYTGTNFLTADSTTSGKSVNDFPVTGGVPLTKNEYDNVSCADPLVQTARNLHGNLFRSITFNAGVGDTTYYSYDDFGRIEWLLRKIGSIAQKKITYKYSQLGNMERLGFIDLGDLTNTKYFHYTYDEVSRVVEVCSSDDSVGQKIQEAKFTYSANGQMKRLQLGNAQGVDYQYNERDWLTHINNQNLTGETTLPPDKFGQVIGYNNVTDIGSSQSAAAQYSGNVSWMMYNTSGLTHNGSSLVGFTYSYDGANRLTSADFGYAGADAGSWVATDAYDVKKMRYDAVGNIDTLMRYNRYGNLMDHFKYTYTGGTNRLASIFNAVGSGTQTYQYDANGNVTSDSYRGLTGIAYDARNLPTSLNRPYSSMTFWYDGNGNRIRKADSEGSDDLYVLDANGQTLAVYKLDNWNAVLRFWNILANGQIIGRIEKYGTAQGQGQQEEE